MALTVESSNKIWQRANAYLSVASPFVQEAFLRLKIFLASQKKNPDLQIFPFSEADADAAGGTVLLAGANKVYGIYLKKENSATDNFFWLYDDATDDTTDASARVSLPVLVANDESMYLNPAGLDMTLGLVVTQYLTSAISKTDGSTGGAGFVIVGQP